MTYAFGDTDLARERLGFVADTFEAPTRTLLRDLPASGYRYVIDMGCGPGFTTALLREAIPHSFATGIDASPAMIAEARERVPDAHFAVADVTAELSLPAHLIYARLLLGHLPDPRSALACWAAALRAGGLVVCEEPVRYGSDDPVFARYEEVVTAVVAARGGTLWAGPALDDDPPMCRRALDRVVEHPVPAARAAAMFWRNAATWGGERDLVDALREIERSNRADVVMWELRQTVWTKTGE
ncbi:MAG: methyltransferase domain-containing protein [Actinomycetota bacterium]|nr:methyltransferase domain-containing protein [Actinomycetota bacterium]